MLNIIANCWPLLLGMALIMLGNGLQGTLLGVRATIEDFGIIVTGLIMSGYFLGLVFGCRIVPAMVRRVGHIRIFGALASLASVSILVQAIFVDPSIWWAMRLVSGFSYAGLYIVAESWLNESSENGLRGRVFSIYMLISLGGMAGGQMLLNLSSPSSFELFLLVSLMISLAMIPILVSVTHAPQYEIMENAGMLMLYRVSPLGVFGMLMSGMAIGAIYGMGAVYATGIGMSVREVSFFMMILILGGFLCQFPLGWLSDRIGRRKVIFLTCISGSLVSFLALFIVDQGILFFVVSALVGGLSLPLYALCAVHTNDYLTPTQMVAASGTLVLLSSLGATLGAPLSAVAMVKFGPGAFFGSIATMLIIVALFALWRMVERTEVDTAEQGDFVVMATTPLSVSLKVDVELNEYTEALAEDTQAVQTSFQELISDLEGEAGENSRKDR